VALERWECPQHGATYVHGQRCLALSCRAHAVKVRYVPEAEFERLRATLRLIARDRALSAERLRMVAQDMLDYDPEEDSP